MTSRRQTRRLLIALLMGISFLGCHRRREYPNAPVLLICPWAAGGGTDRVSRHVAALLERELDVPVNVINATGGAGVTGHTRGALARPDGYTITMVTVEINMLHWRGLTSISYKDYEPVGMLNCDAAALFVRQDAPWQDLKQLEKHVRQNRGELRASGTAQGGIWHLGFAGWLNSVGLSPADARWISINGAAPSLQELLAGGVDAVCCSLPEAQASLDAGRIRCLGVMSPERLGPFPNVPTFTEQGVDWTLTGWRGICLPKETPAEPRERLAAALAKVAASDDFRTFMSNAGFKVDWQPTDQFGDRMAQVDEQLGRLLTSPEFQSMRQTRFGPKFFPAVLGALMALVLAMLAVSGGLRRPPEIRGVTGRDAIRAVEVMAWVVAYVAIAEIAGFLVTAGALLLLLMWRLGNHWAVNVAVSVAIVVLTYQLFAVGLRVPLPRGWLGW